MVQQKRIRTANDNVPPLHHLQRTLHGQLAAYSDQNQASRPALENTVQALTIPANNQRKVRSLRLTQLLWLASILSVIAAILFSAPVEYKAFSLVALLWMSLWSSYVFTDHKLPRLKEIAVLSTMACFLSAFALLATLLSLSIAPLDGVVLATLGALVLAGVMKSRIALLGSITASLIWAVMAKQGTAITTPLLFVFPFIAIAQAYICTKINSGLTIGLSIVTGYYWIAWLLTDLWSTGNMPLTFAASAFSIIGMAHLRLGKVAEDTGMIGSNLHLYAGWAASIVGALIFQIFWLDSDILGASTAFISAQGLQNWKHLIMGCLAIVFVSGIIRYKYSQITLTGIVLVTLVTALMPAMLWKPDWTVVVMDGFAGMKAMPTFGIIIGAAILSSSISLIANGLRRNTNIMIALGLLGMVSQAVLLLDPTLTTADNIVVFFTAVLIALTISAAVAGNSIAHQAPPPRLKPKETFAR